MQGKILIIEDVKELAELMALYLTREGFEIRAVKSAEEGFDILEAWKPELIILDINLPGMDGFEFLQKIRPGNKSPVLIVSARDSDEDLISGLSGGADEFMTKPFSPNVLAARVRALFRRVRDYEEKEPRRVFRFGPFVLDYDTCILKKADVRIPLSNKEYTCLAYLSEHAGKTLNPETIYAGVWNNPYGDLTTVAVYIQRLRKKIEDDPANPLYIKTVFGMGYCFSLPGG
ncbi:MAG: response regulator transcription factor [Treponema sp.]|jgi:two-component system response regulator RegX3|nr:response regulator transcription factor [Treponema sp.]